MNLVGDLWRLFRARARRGGAEESGLTAMSTLNHANAAADAFVTVALASTLFFAVPTGEARGRVALYLLTTIAPFAVVAPLIGPALDRFGRARRAAMGVALVVRAVLAWMTAGHVGGITLYPLALGLLVFSKGFSVARSAVIPRVLPPGGNLVAVNSRLQLASTIGTVLAVPIAAGLSHELGYRSVLRVAALGYLLTILLVQRLPAHVDSPRSARERGASGLAAAVGVPWLHRFLGNLPAALRGVLPLRALVGFLTLFLAFYLRSTNRGTSSLAVLAAVVGVCNALGLILGGAASRRRPEALIVVAQLLALGSCVAAAIFFSFYGALALAGLATLAAVMAKLALDAVIQRDIAEDTRASAFGKSETAVQLAWVIGGAFGLIPFGGRTGFIVITVAMGAMLIYTVPGIGRRRPSPRNSRGSRSSRTVGSRA